MNSKYSVLTAFRLETGDVAVSGSVTGPLLTAGQKGFALTSSGPIEVLVVGIGVSDRTIGPPDRQGILVKMLNGEPTHLSGITLEFADGGRGVVPT